MRLVHADQKIGISTKQYGGQYYSHRTYIPKITLDWEAYLDAMLLQREAKTSLEGPPCPTI